MLIRGDFFDYDPITGLTEYYEETYENGRPIYHIHTFQDVEPLMDYTQKLRNEGQPDAAWKERGATMYASLPMSVVGQMMKQGINIFDQNDMPRVIHEINTNYSKFKTTYKHHEL